MARHIATRTWRATCRAKHALPFLLLIVSAVPARSQDTTGIYHDIERFSAKRKFTRWIYGGIFVEPEQGEAPPAPGTPPRRTDPLLPYSGRIVRNVEILVLDPFGFDLSDSSAFATAWIQHAGNFLHRTTREYLVREFVLVKANEAFDPLKAAESERLLRAAPMVTDARVFVVPVPGSKDSIDVHVLVLDKWSLEAWGEIGGDAGSITLLDRNLMGLGQELRIRQAFGLERLVEQFDASHAVYNITGTYISSLLEYSKNELTERVALRFDRPFYSPLTRWAGAFGIARSWNKKPVTDAQGTLIRTDRVDPFDIDAWSGRSFPLANASTNAARSSVIVAGARYTRTRYTRRLAVDSMGVLSQPKSDIFLLSTGLSVRQYYRDRYLYRFGVVEDVPEGLLVKLTGGFRDREGEELLGYTAVEFSRGRHFSRFGYASAQLAYGTFWEQGAPVDAILRMELRYFSDLFRVRRWYLRQFVTLAAVSIDRKAISERLDLNGDQLFGFSSAGVSGSHRELLKFETVAYAPWRVLGFRFAPVLLAGFGTIGETGDPLLTGRIHTALGLGILVRNENLLAKTFEVSLSFYPYVPEEDGWILDVGRYANFTTRFSDFAFTQPGVAGY